ncbi:MAG: LysM peptidoglycan-binding domain-containing protein [Alphaproteobacteria bacterium]|nr:MAG: LysM peptidoglycan-binding domain-containing protein [Alphaproteobacteria bacterium]
MSTDVRIRPGLHPALRDAARRGRALALLVLAAIASILLVPAEVSAQDHSRDILVGRLIGEPRSVIIRREDTLIRLAMRYDIGFVELRAANPGVDVWVPQPGARLVLPTMHIAPPADGAAIIVNRAELRLYAYPADGPIWSAPISLGRDGYETPLGEIPIGEKKANPAWYPTAAHRAESPALPRVVPPGPDNPLGRHALRLGHTEYLLHGTNRPDSIGREVSRGCIRLSPGDIAWLYDHVARGAIVRIIDAPAKLAQGEDGRLYLEIAPSRDQVAALDMGQTPPDDPFIGVEDMLMARAGDLASRIDWSEVARIARERRGVPEPITPPVTRRRPGASLTSASSG